MDGLLNSLKLAEGIDIRILIDSHQIVSRLFFWLDIYSGDVFLSSKGTKDRVTDRETQTVVA